MRYKLRKQAYIKQSHCFVVVPLGHVRKPLGAENGATRIVLFYQEARAGCDPDDGNSDILEKAPEVEYRNNSFSNYDGLFSAFTTEGIFDRLQER